MQAAPPRFDPLMAFYEWYVTRFGLTIPPSIADGVTRVGGVSGLVLYRHGRYQVQLWLCDPGSSVPDHSHPNVDSLQVYLSGQVLIRLNGEKAVNYEDLSIDEHGMSKLNGRFLRVRPTDTHGAEIGPLGGAFMTFQEWLNGEPKSVEQDWQGEPLSEEHANQLAAG